MSVVDVPAPPLDAEAEALFREARRRAHRRRLRRLAIGFAITASAALIYGVGFASSTRRAGPAALTPFADRSAFAGRGRLAFVSQGRLWLLDGTRLEAVSRPGQQTAHPQFAPDGRWLTYTTASGEEWIARADGAGAWPIARAPANQTWLPDGRLVAGGSIWRIAPTGRPVRVAAEPNGVVAWAPDGSRYVFFASSGPLRTASSVSRPPIRSPARGRVVRDVEQLLHAERHPGERAARRGRAAPPRRGPLPARPQRLADLPTDGLMLNELRAPGASPVALGPTVDIPIVASADGPSR